MQSWPHTLKPVFFIPHYPAPGPDVEGNGEAGEGTSPGPMHRVRMTTALWGPVAGLLGQSCQKEIQ